MSNRDDSRDVFDILINQQDHILNAVSVIKEDISEIKVIQARHEENLKLHMKRSDMIEEQVVIYKQELEQKIQKQEEQIQPVADHVKNVKFLIKLVAGFGTLIAIILGILQVYQLIQS